MTKDEIMAFLETLQDLVTIDEKKNKISREIEEQLEDISSAMVENNHILDTGIEVFKKIAENISGNLSQSNVFLDEISKQFVAIEERFTKIEEQLNWIGVPLKRIADALERMVK